MNKAETRAEHIDPALKAAGWGLVEGSRIRREYPITPGHRKTRKARQVDFDIMFHRRLRPFEAMQTIQLVGDKLVVGRDRPRAKFTEPFRACRPAEWCQ
jgi:hypothetical protein